MKTRVLETAPGELAAVEISDGERTFIIRAGSDGETVSASINEDTGLEMPGAVTGKGCIVVSTDPLQVVCPDKPGVLMQLTDVSTPAEKKFEIKKFVEEPKATVTTGN